MSMSARQLSPPKLLLEVAALPYHPTPPVFCAALKEHFVIVGRDEVRDEVMLTLIGFQGDVVSHEPLPIRFVEGLVSCQDEVHLWGGDGSSLRDLLLSPEGRVVAESPLLVGQDILFMPQLVCGAGLKALYWVDAQGELQLRQEEQKSTIALSGITLALTAVMIPSGLTLLRLVGVPGYLEMLHIVNGRLHHNHPVTDIDQAYCPLLFWREDHYLLLWLSRASRSLQLQRFAPDFSPLAPAQTTLTLNAPQSFRWLRSLAGHNSGEIILAWQIEQPGERLNELGQPLPDLAQTLAILDPVEARVYGTTAVHYPAESYFTGCQSDGKLMLIMGGGQATVLVYQL